jgi:hypothetical protein
MLVFASALVGIAGKTWDPKKSGFARLTLQGRVVISIACLSLGYGLFTVYDNHRELDQKAQLSQIAHRQILYGIAEMLKPLCHYTNDVRQYSIEQTFSQIRNGTNLEKAGHERLVSKLGGTIVATTSRGYSEVEQLYQLYDLYIEDGSNLINDALVKFSSIISPQDIIYVEEMLQDDFFIHTYKLSGRKNYFDLGLYDEKDGAVNGDSPWLTAGLHWFNAVYIKGKERAPNYERFFAFLDKSKTVAISIARDVGDHKFDPCS